jgi:hypothetical protein
MKAAKKHPPSAAKDAGARHSNRSRRLMDAGSGKRHSQARGPIRRGAHD